jgi:hypothetical protein
MSKNAKTLILYVISIVFASVFFGCGSRSPVSESGGPDPEYSYCAYGLAALQYNSGNVESARVTFADMIALPNASPVDSPDNVMKMYTDKKFKDYVVNWADNAYQKHLSRWQVGVLIYTQYNHWLYIDAMYPTSPDKTSWHFVCIETSKNNFGQRIEFNVSLTTDGNGVDIERIVSGKYRGVEVGQYYTIMF